MSAVTLLSGASAALLVWCLIDVRRNGPLDHDHPAWIVAVLLALAWFALAFVSTRGAT